MQTPPAASALPSCRSLAMPSWHSCLRSLSAALPRALSQSSVVDRSALPLALPLRALIECSNNISKNNMAATRLCKSVRACVCLCVLVPGRFCGNRSDFCSLLRLLFWLPRSMWVWVWDWGWAALMQLAWFFAFLAETALAASAAAAALLSHSRTYLTVIAHHLTKCR